MTLVLDYFLFILYNIFELEKEYTFFILTSLNWIDSIQKFPIISRHTFILMGVVYVSEVLSFPVFRNFFRYFFPIQRLFALCILLLSGFKTPYLFITGHFSLITYNFYCNFSSHFYDFGTRDYL